MSAALASLEYLATCSDESLESFHLARLNRAALLRKQILEILESWVQSDVEARIARWMLEKRRLADRNTAGLQDPRGAATPQREMLATLQMALSFGDDIRRGLPAAMPTNCVDANLDSGRERESAAVPETLPLFPKANGLLGNSPPTDPAPQRREPAASSNFEPEEEPQGKLAAHWGSRLDLLELISGGGLQALARRVHA